MHGYRVSKEKEGQDRAARSHRESTAYKYILRNLHIISFEQVVFCKQVVELGGRHIFSGIRA